ncbi:MAG TPA: carbohydrate kinase family protein [Acidobacteriaceae bacterium]
MRPFDITIAGEINLDLILYGLAEQMPVERELLADDFRLTLGSSSAILAHNLAALGMNVGFITKVGTDPLGTIALQRLQAAGVDFSSILTADGLQTGVTILLHHGITRHILTYPGVMADMSCGELNFEYLASSRHFHISSLFLQKSLQPGLPALCRQLKERGVTLSLDTNDDPDDVWGEPLQEMLGLVDVLLPNEDEAMRMTHTADVESAAASLAQRVPVVAVKCGSRGSLVRTGQEQWSIPSVAITPIDTIGAGDSFNAGFLQGYVRGLPLPACAEQGNVAAALSTLRPGGTESFRDATLLHTFLAEHPTALHVR